MREHFGDYTFIEHDASPLTSFTAEIVGQAVKLGRERYKERPERLCAVFCSSTEPNAIAAWGRRDWIVISDALMARLHKSAEALAPKVMHEIGVEETRLGAIMQKAKPIPGFSTAMASCLYVGAVAFIAGHEVGHHLEGHDGYYLPGAVRLRDASDKDVKLEQQALEIGPDERGTIISRQILTPFLLQFFDGEMLNQEVQAEYQAVLATVLSVGLFSALAIIRPRSIGMKDAAEKRHPPGALRALLLSEYLSQKINENCGLLSPDVQWQIRMVSLDIAAAESVGKGAKEAAILNRAKKNEPLGLRAAGIRRALFDPDLRYHMRELLDIRNRLRSTLRPR
ncbi:hypothetical protein PFF91_03485 [Burkholderia cenocepacia]|uniref:hypothetical protein n=1 Tax=Burkholderia cenocepacia TaxID=95486 RepID=UPI0022EACEE8|nr:hypothetical protein [Burkholderia cenocepacia]MDA3668085.1 hypothetical protein [Burkholderia cenocepacia]MDA3675266.1 hypothetical protein [Burkholderia cenocepacia]MDA3683249.1 hypothetical protein [Burkholderia cenocepacia]MDA3690036.1 hypothetical protein [Burkholderia cenocepacia]MDA3697962.1 hypothetical protein [Burkholderia cenocepacia]